LPERDCRKIAVT